MSRDEMTINNRSIKEYNARLLSYSISGTERSYSQSSVGALLQLPDVYHTTLSPRRLSITLTFFPKAYATENGRNRSIPERLTRSTDNIVRFESDISNKELEIGLPDGYIYKAFLKSCQTPSFDETGEQDVEYIFDAIRTKPTVTRTVTAGGSIHCESNTVTPFRLSCVIPSAMDSITICGVLIGEIDANTEIVIDSERGLVTANGVNKFSDTELVDFPKLAPGNNTIECSVSGLKVTVVYTPIYA